MKKLLCMTVVIGLLGLSACVPPPHDGHGTRLRGAGPSRVVRASEHKPVVKNHPEHKEPQAKPYKAESHYRDQGGPIGKNEKPHDQPKH